MTLSLERPANVPRCHVPWQQMVIDSTGYVAPCCYWGAVDNDSGEALGDINLQTIDEIWNGPGYQKLRAGMAAGDLAAAGCANCHAVRQGMALAFEYDPSCETEFDQPLAEQSAYARNIQVLKHEVASGATVMEAKPTVVSYTPSHRCNIRCTHCYQETTRTAEINRVRAHDEVAQLAPHLVRLVAGGGEPFLLPIWISFLNDFDVAANPYLDFSTSTNATVVTDKVAAGLSRFKKLTINISVDGTGEAFERVRVGAKFATVSDNIRRLKTIVASTERTDSALGVSMCVMKSNIHDLSNFVRYATTERLSFGLTPVTMLPAAESLRHFVDGARETQGWSQALDDAEALVHTLYLPEMAKARNAPAAHPIEHEFWRNNFKLLREAIPFDLTSDALNDVTIALPAPLLRQFPALRSGGSGMPAFVYQREKTYLPFTHGLARDGLLSVALPPGAYCVNLPRTTGDVAGYWDVVRFDVTAQTQGQVRATYHPLTRRRIYDRVERALGPQRTARLPWIGDLRPTQA
jgi:MoaA/NifB/PqqE/SkfB family radical SAM enzyme